MSDSYWPLYKISEPHASNDVLLPEKGQRLGEWLEGGSSWKSNAGNSLFLQSVKARRDSFSSKTRLEQPLVTLDLLRQWRNQVPPGRFLVAELNTRPPLFEDVGDKRARTFISKLLKHLIKSDTEERDPRGDKDEKKEKETAGGYPEDKLSTLATTPQRTNANQRPLSPPSTKAEPQNNNRLLGREKELETLFSIYETARTRHLRRKIAINNSPAYVDGNDLDEEHNQIDAILLSGTAGVGKSSLVNSFRQYRPSNNKLDEKGDETNNHDEPETPLVVHAERRPPSVLEWLSPKHEMMARIIHDFCRQLLDDGSQSHMLDTYRLQILQDLDEDDIEELTIIVPLLNTVLQGGMSDNNSFTDDHDRTSSTQTNKSSTVSEGSMRLSSTSSSGAGGRQEQERHVSFFATPRPMLVFGRFLQALAAASSQPVIVFTQNMQFSKDGTWTGYLLFVKSMARYCGSSVVFVCTFSNDIMGNIAGASVEFGNGLKELAGVHVHHFELDNLSEEHTRMLISRQLDTTNNAIDKQFSSWMHGRAQGHPKFTLELLKYFQAKDLLGCNPISKEWFWDMKRMDKVVKPTDSLSELYQTIVRDTDPGVQEVLKIGAYLCTPRISLNMLNLLSEHDDVNRHVEEACALGLTITDDECGFIDFASVKIRNAMYDLIPVDEREPYHLQLAQALWKHVGDYKQDSEYLAMVLKQFMMSDTLVTKEEDRRTVAVLCLQVGQAAAKSIGNVTAMKCISHGLSILETQKKWGAKNYDLSLQFHNLAIELCYCNLKYKELEGFIDEVLSHARTLDDSLIAKSTQLYALGSRNRQTEAIQIGLETLHSLGEHFQPNEPSTLRMIWGFRHTRKLLQGKSDDDILHLKKMKDSKKLAAMRIMNHVILYLVFLKPKLGALMAMRMVRLTIQHGLCTLSSVAFTLYGVVVSCQDSHLEEGFRYGRLALKIYDKFKTEVWLCRISAGYYGSLHSKKYPFREAVEPLRRAHRVGLRTGDIEFAMINACLLCWNICEQTPLPALDRHIRELARETQHLGQRLSTALLKPLWQCVQNLMGNAVDDPKQLKGKLVDEDMELALSGNNRQFLLWTNFYKMQLAYLFSDFDLAESYSYTSHELYDTPTGGVDIAYALFYESLVLLAQARRGKRRLRNILYVRSRVRRIRRWSVHSPINFLGKQMLLEAELAALSGRHARALTYYRSSVLHLREGGFLLPIAIANERLGTYLMETNDREGAGSCLQKAHDLYKEWGGSAKLQHFKKEWEIFFSGTRSAPPPAMKPCAQ